MIVKRLRCGLAFFALSVFLSAAAFSDEVKEDEYNTMKVTIGTTVLEATLEDNSTAKALIKLLTKGSISISMKDYGNMEKVGLFTQSLPRNDKQITTEAGDLVLYQGNSFVIYYASNSWNFTRFGKIRGITPQALKKILGDGDVSVTLSLK